MAQAEKKGGEENKSRQKLIIIIASTVLLSIASTVTAIYFLNGGFGRSENEKTETEGHVQKEEFYFDMSQPLIVDFSSESAVRLIQVSVSFLVEQAEAVDALKKHEPMIRNNLLMMINAQGAEHLKTREGKEQLRSAMQQEVSAILKKMAGMGQIKEVFFTSFVMQ